MKYRSLMTFAHDSRDCFFDEFYCKIVIIGIKKEEII